MAKTAEKKAEAASGLFDDEPKTVIDDERKTNIDPGMRELPPFGSGTILKEAPYNGVPVLLTPDGEHWFPAYWKQTRQVNMRTKQWEKTAFWAALPGQGGQRLPFEPIGWKPFEEPLIGGRPA